MRKKFPVVVKELLSLILVYGLLSEVIICIVTKDFWYHFIGLLIGLILAAGMCIHLYWSLDEALDYGEAGAGRYFRKSFAIRIVVVSIILGITFYFQIGNVITSFIGLMGLKFGAYLQPVTHKYVQKFCIGE